MTTRNFNQEERSKLKTLMTEAVSVMTEVETLNGGLNDTIKAIAEEMEIKPALLKKAIKMAQSRNYDQHRSDMDLIESILHGTGNLNTDED